MYTEQVIIDIFLKLGKTNCNIMIDGENFLDQPVKNDIRSYDNIRKVGTGQGDDYTTGCLIQKLL